jgi:hypothetical protein
LINSIDIINSNERDYYTTNQGDLFINPSPDLDLLRATELGLNDPSLNQVSQYGHAAGSLGSSGVYSSFVELAQHVVTAEAQGYSWRDKEYIPSLDDEVAYVPMTKYWVNHNPTAYRTGAEMWPRISDSEGSRMARFWGLHCFGKTTYSILVEKDKNPVGIYDMYGDGVYEKTYCSLFLWQALYSKTNRRIDIDSDGGKWCFPNDILRDAPNKYHFVRLWRLI